MLLVVKTFGTKFVMNINLKRLLFICDQKRTKSFSLTPLKFNKFSKVCRLLEQTLHISKASKLKLYCQQLYKNPKKKTL